MAKWGFSESKYILIGVMFCVDNLFKRLPMIKCLATIFWFENFKLQITFGTLSVWEWV